MINDIIDYLFLKRRKVRNSTMPRCRKKFEFPTIVRSIRGKDRNTDHYQSFITDEPSEKTDYIMEN